MLSIRIETFKKFVSFETNFKMLFTCSTLRRGGNFHFDFRENRLGTFTILTVQKVLATTRMIKASKLAFWKLYFKNLISNNDF
jgi:hypothetical protein